MSRPQFVSIPYPAGSIFAPERKWSSSMRNAPRDAIPSPSVHEIDAAPPAPSEVFARLGVMLVVALAFGLSAQFLVAALPH
jgi:uncharacterized protein involved in exopolysaccharide biosynthesis